MKRLFQIIIYIFAGIGFVLSAGYLALQIGFTKTSGIIDGQHDYFQNQGDDTAGKSDSWITGAEWSVLKEAIEKDSEPIQRAAKTAGVPTRLIVAPLVVEQLRLFYSEREIFKQVFAPLKILGNQSQFSWGVMGIKQKTAVQIEKNLKDPQSPWYLGKESEHLLDFVSATTSSDANNFQINIDKERFKRLTDENDRYYSYLYAAILIKEIEAQWERAGFPISIENKNTAANSIAILATLYNIGFENSHPNANPLSGGAEIKIDDVTYSFGSLAQSFYDSEELVDVFPR